MTYDISATHAFNKFVQAKLVEAGFMTLANYNGLSPFIPAQQQPELTNLPSAIPFVVYNYAADGAYEEWWLEHEQVAYTIYSDQEKQIRQIVHFINQLCRRFDWTAKDINAYIKANGSAAQKEFDFKYVRTTSMASIEPATEEGGRYSATIVMSLCFTSNLNQQGMRV